MAKAAHGDAGTEVHVVATLRIPHPRALPALEDELARPVDRKVVIAAQGKQGRGIESGFRHSGRLGQ